MSTSSSFSSPRDEESTHGIPASEFTTANIPSTKQNYPSAFFRKSRMIFPKLRQRLAARYHGLRKYCVIECPNAVNLSIWVLGFFVMVGMTTRDLLPIFDDYNNNNLAAQMDLKTEQINPNFTICLPYYSTYLFVTLNLVRNLDAVYLNGTKNVTEDVCGRCWQLQEAGWNFWIHMNSTQVNSTKTVVGYVVRRFYEEGWYKVKLTEENFHYMQFLSDAVWYYFYWMYQSDLNVLTSQDFSGLKDTVDWISHEALDWMPRDAVDTLYETMMDYLEQCIFGECVQRNGGDLTFDHKFPGFRLRNHTVTIAGDEFCFPAPTAEFGANDFTCSFSRWPWLWDRYGSSSFEVYSSPAVLYATVRSKDAVYSTTYGLKKNKNESEHVFVTYQITQRMAGHRLLDPTCSDEASVERCIAKGQVDVAMRDCHCMPFTFRTVLPGHDDNSSVPYCNSTAYNWCSKKLRRNLDQLQSKCKNKCEYTFFDFDPKQSVKYNEYNETVPQFMVTFSSANTPYVEFSSEVKTTPSQFVSQIGGIVNLYLGGSGLTIFTIIILCLDQSRNWHKQRVRRIRRHKEKKQRKASTHSTRSTKPSDVWQFLRVVGVFHSLGQNKEVDEEKAKVGEVSDGGEEEEETANDEPGNDMKHRMDRMEEKMCKIDQNLDEVNRRMRRLEEVLEKLASREMDSRLYRRAVSVNTA